MRASIETLRTALRAADSSTLDEAIYLLVFYINESKPYPETLEKLLAPIEGDATFNERLGLVRQQANV